MDYLCASLTFGNLTQALKTDLTPFAQKGGKILHYHGMGDELISAGNSVSEKEHCSKLLADPLL